MLFDRHIVGCEFIHELHTNRGLKDIGDTVLEIGFKDGEVVGQFLEYGYNVEAVDIDCEACTRIFETLKLNDISSDHLTVHNIDVLRFEFHPTKYSCIVCNNVLHFLDKDQGIKLLQDLAIALKNGGFLIVAVHHEDHPLRHQSRRTLRNSHYNDSDFHKICEGQMRILFQADVINNFGQPCRTILYVMAKAD